MAKELLEEKLEMNRMTECLEEEMFELKNKVIFQRLMEKMNLYHLKHETELFDWEQT